MAIFLTGCFVSSHQADALYVCVCSVYVCVCAFQTGKFVSDDVTEQTEQVLKNLRAILTAAGTTEQNGKSVTMIVCKWVELRTD